MLGGDGAGRASVGLASLTTLPCHSELTRGATCLGPTAGNAQVSALTGTRRARRLFAISARAGLGAAAVEQARWDDDVFDTSAKRERGQEDGQAPTPRGPAALLAIAPTAHLSPLIDDRQGRSSREFRHNALAERQKVAA